MDNSLYAGQCACGKPIYKKSKQGAPPRRCSKCAKERQKQLVKKHNDRYRARQKNPGSAPLDKGPIYMGQCACGEPIYKKRPQGPDPTRCSKCAEERRIALARERGKKFRKREKELIEEERKHMAKSLTRYSHRMKAKDHPDYYKGWLRDVLSVDRSSSRRFAELLSKS